MNESIKTSPVIVIDQDGANLGTIETHQAIQRAQQSGLDLVVVSPNASPPVCRIMDYGKKKFDLRRKKQSQKKQSRTQVKEIKMRPVIDVGDYNIKCKKIKGFIEAGHRVKVMIRFRGREVTHQEIGEDLVERLLRDLAEHIQVEQVPKLEGKQILFVIVPKRKS